MRETASRRRSGWWACRVGEAIERRLTKAERKSLRRLIDKVTGRADLSCVDIRFALHNGLPAGYIDVTEKEEPSKP